MHQLGDRDALVVRGLVLLSNLPGLANQQPGVGGGGGGRCVINTKFNTVECKPHPHTETHVPVHSTTCT